MKKFFLTAVAVIACAIVASAAKPTVYVEEFSNPKDYKEAWVEIVRNGVVEALTKSGRVDVVDAVTEQSRMDEEIRRMKDNVAQNDLETTKALEIRGSHFLLNGTITTIDVKEAVLESGTHSFDAFVTFTLKVVNAIDGEVIDTETFTLPKQGFMGLGGSLAGIKKGVMESADAAVASLKGDVAGGLKKFVDQAFPLNGIVEAVEESKGKEAKTLYISLGSRDGVAKGNKFEVRGSKKIGSKVVTKVIGEVEVTEVDDEMSLCKVKKGGAEIMAAVATGDPVIVRTMSK